METDAKVVKNSGLCLTIPAFFSSYPSKTVVRTIKGTFFALLSDVMNRTIRYALLLCAVIIGTTTVMAQTRKLQHRPYLDQRLFHYGFLLGFQIQDLEVRNNGYIDPATGEQWYSDVDCYNPGFTVGVIGELRLNTHFSLRLSPSMHFGQKRMWFHEQVSGRDTTQNLKSTFISIPIDIKISAPRYNNFRPYFITGVSPMIDLTARKHGALRTKPFDCYLDFGLGCDFYLPYFKLNPELKFCLGLLDILDKKRTDLTDGTLVKFTKGLDSAHAKMIVLTLNFE